MKFQKHFLASLVAIGFSLGSLSTAQADSVSELGSLYGDYLAASYADERRRDSLIFPRLLKQRPKIFN